MRNFPTYFWQRFQELKEATALIRLVDGKTDAESEEESYWDWTRRIQRIAVKLLEDGFEAGDRLALIAPNSAKWLDVAFGAWLAGGCVVPIAPDLDRTTTLRCLGRTGCRWIVVQDAQTYGRIRGQGANIPEHLEWILLDWDGDTGIGDATTLQQLDGEGRSLVSRGRVDDLGEHIYGLDKEAPALILFEPTPGQDPHGAFFSGRKVAKMLDYLAGTLPLGADTDWATQASWSNPGSLLIALAVLLEGRGLIVGDGPDDLARNLPLVHPTHLVCSSSFLVQKTKRWRERIQEAPEFMRGEEEADAEGEASPGREGFGFSKLLNTVGERAAERLFYRPLRREFGGKLEALYVPGEGVPSEVEDVLESADTAVLDVFGLPECGISHVEHPGTQRRGAVGRPIHGYKCRIASDGEVLIATDVLFDDYWDEKGPRTVDGEGWLHTGLTGRLEDGFLYIDG